jgi:hypothetical protein
VTAFIGRIIVQPMGANPPGPASPNRPASFSPDGFWWWDGTQWRSAISADGRWRWNGTAWEPHHTGAPAKAGGGGATTAILITVLAFGGILVLVGILVAASLYAMGDQISNVFSNVIAALGATPSP